LSPKIEPKFKAKLKDKVELLAQTERPSIVNFESQIEKLQALKKSEVFSMQNKEAKDSVSFKKQHSDRDQDIGSYKNKSIVI
jgi:hypothetical protein